MGKDLNRDLDGILGWIIASSEVTVTQVKLLLILGTSLVLGIQAVAATIPPKAKIYGPGLVLAQTETWPDAPDPWTVAGQVEQESCISLTHRKCWDPTAELKTSREYGFGFGQVTRAYNRDGSVRFDKFSELVGSYPSLKAWTWESRFDASYQFKALVELDKTLYQRLTPLTLPSERWAFTLSAYNGGLNGVLRDQLLCQNQKACNPQRWFDNVEKYSMKSKIVMPGYGKSPFTINREYPRLILETRRQKYRQLWEAME